jgi:hypothetical protein
MWLLFWWLLVPYHILKWIFRAARKSNIDTSNDRIAERADKTRAAQIAELDATLRAAVPTAPVQKMRATIRFGELSAPKLDYDYSDRYGSITRDTGQSETMFTVDMIVELSEQERAIILKHNLDFVELEREAMFSPLELSLMEDEDQRELDATSEVRDPYLKAAKKMGVEQAKALRTNYKQITTVGDLLVVPYRRQFGSAHDAKKHAEVLKTKLLPQLRLVLNQYKEHRTTETLEF